MKTATIIGSGITGPMAAIILKGWGFDVTVYEARPEEDLYSDGILGITPDNIAEMQAVGVKLARHMLDNTFRTWPMTEVKRSTYTYITWTNLHRDLTQRAEELGVTFHYATPFEWGTTPVGDVAVITTGVGSAKQVSTAAYTGYVVLRGLAYQYSGTPWTTIYGDSDSGPWLFNIGDSDDGASVEFFVKRPAVQQRTTYSAVAPAEVKDLPERFRRLMETVPMWQQAPLSDWTVPDHLVTTMVQGRATIRLGDANGQMRPQTSMGANLALYEASRLPILLDPNEGQEEEADLLRRRQREYLRGQEIGIQRGKFSK